MAEHPERPRDYEKIKNTQERRAHLIVDLLEDRAQHVVDALDEPPPQTQEPDAATVRAMWTFSPFGERAPETFWMLHDLALEKLLADVVASGVTGDERMKAMRAAYQKAESSALGRVFPHRAALCMLGITTPERSVELAKRAARLVAREDRRTEQMPRVQEATAY